MNAAQNSLEVQIPAFGEIEEAAKRLRDVLPRTRLFESETLNQRAGGRLLIKAETLLPTGSFKVRGAWNTVSQLSSEASRHGIVALSSGNHGQAVAWAARKASIARTVVFMPSTTPAAKLDRTRAWGAEIRLFDRDSADRQSLIEGAVENEGLHYIPAFDHRHVIAGAGTVALEVAEELAGTAIDTFVAACSGGGLMAGCALAMEALSPATEVWGVEPEGYDDTAQSLQQGHIVTLPFTNRSICDAILSPSPGPLTFQVNKRLLSGVMTGTDVQAMQGMKKAFEEFGLVVEPGGALALGVLLANRERTTGRTTVVVLSGRNVDPDLYADAILATSDGEER